MDAPTGTARPGSPPPSSPRRTTGRWLLWSIVAAAVAFLIGFGWQWYEARTVRQQLAETQEQLLVERLRIQLGQAALASQAGDFESARQQMSDFFTRVSETRASLPDSVAVITDRFLDRRDEIITALSRSNPEYAGVLYGMLQTFRRGTAVQPSPAQSPRPSPVPATTDTAAADSAAGG